jgi:hypothetical protein
LLVSASASAQAPTSPAAVESSSLRSLSTGEAGTISLSAGVKGEFSGRIEVAPGENRLELAFDLVGPLEAKQLVTVLREPGS